MLMLLGARVLTVEVGTSKYEMGGGKKEPVGMGWRYCYELIISKMCMCLCIHVCTYVKYMGTYIMCEYVYVHG